MNKLKLIILLITGFLVITLNFPMIIALLGVALNFPGYSEIKAVISTKSKVMNMYNKTLNSEKNLNYVTNSSGKKKIRITGYFGAKSTQIYSEVIGETKGHQACMKYFAMFPLSEGWSADKHTQYCEGLSEGRSIVRSFKVFKQEGKSQTEVNVLFKDKYEDEMYQKYVGSLIIIEMYSHEDISLWKSCFIHYENKPTEFVCPTYIVWDYYPNEGVYRTNAPFDKRDRIIGGVINAIFF